MTLATNTRCTTIKPTQLRPPHPTRTNGINLYPYLPAHIYLAFELALDPYPVFYTIMIPHASCRRSFSPFPFACFRILRNRLCTSHIDF